MPSTEVVKDKDGNVISSVTTGGGMVVGPSDETPPHADKRMSDLTVLEYLELSRWIDKRHRSVQVRDIKAVSERICAIEDLSKP